MTAVGTDLPSVEWLSDDQLAAVDFRHLVGSRELLRNGALARPWQVKLRESTYDRLETARVQTLASVARLRRFTHELQSPVDLRHHSEVAHHIGHSFDHVVETFAGPIEERVGGIQLSCGPGSVTTRPIRFEAEGLLRIPGSYPGLPIRLAVEPWWRDRCVVGLSLRASHRIRYPRRYFRSAHRVLAELTRTPSSESFGSMGSELRMGRA
jgi:hypothetical protein